MWLLIVVHLAGGYVSSAVVEYQMVPSMATCEAAGKETVSQITAVRGTYAKARYSCVDINARASSPTTDPTK